MNDEGFREIQLNGKQLVFLFMAATVVSVVIFLCGVLVGRNARGGTETSEVAAADVAPDPAVPVEPPPALTPAPAVVAPAGTAARGAEELTYTDRLLREAPTEEKLKSAQAAPQSPSAAPGSAPTIKEPVVAQPPAPRAAPPDKEGRAAVPAPAERTLPPAPASAAEAVDPSGPGYAIQVAAYRDRRDADSLAKQLIAKGYPAFVMEPVKGAPMTMFRVRVGKYRNLKDAEAISARLQTAEQFDKAWIAR